MASITQPLCVTCQHPRSFHGEGGACKALGCTTCSAYVSPIVMVEDETTGAKEAYPYPGDRNVVVKVGQVWADNDPRRPGRRVRVDDIVEEDGEQVAVVTVVATDAPKSTGSGMGAVKKVKVRRFRPTSTGYRLVS